MSLMWLLVLLLLVFAVLGAPGVTINHGLGYAPSGIVTIVLVVLLILLLTGRL